MNWSRCLGLKKQFVVCEVFSLELTMSSDQVRTRFEPGLNQVRTGESQA